MSVPVPIPQVTDNDDRLLITDVLVKDGDQVAEGDVLAEMETSKAAVELTAPAAGWVKVLDCEGGQDYPIGHVFCHIAATADEKIKVAKQAAPVKKAKKVAKAKAVGTKGKQSTGDVTATPQASQLAEILNIDLGAMGRDVVRTADILPYALGDDSRHEFLRQIKADPAFRKLTSALKIMAYRNAGFDIAESAVLEDGVLLLAPLMRVGENVRIGAGTVIACDVELKIGSGTSIGGDGDMECVRLVIGCDARIMENIKFDVSGGGVPEAGIFIGDRTLVSAGCYINGCRPVTLGTRVALSPRAMIFTHRFWHNIFDGNDAAFAAVTLEDEAWLGAAAQIGPGVTVGAGAQIMSGSMVVHSLPANSMAAGIPAKVLKQDVHQELSAKDKVARLEKELGAFLAILESRGCTVKGGTKEALITSPSDRSYRLAWPNYPTKDLDGVETITLGFGLKDTGASAIDFDRPCVFGPKTRMTDELRDFFRRRGLDFQPFEWSFDRSQPL